MSWKSVSQAQWCRVLMHGLSLGHRDPLDPQGHQGRMAPLEEMVSQATLGKMENPVTLGLRASRERKETWAPKVRRGILGLVQEDPQDPKGLRGHQDPPSDTTS